jgi:hypothetical protein
MTADEKATGLDAEGGPSATGKARRPGTSRKLNQAIKAALAAGLSISEAFIAPDGGVKLTFATGNSVAPSPKNDWD